MLCTYNLKSTERHARYEDVSVCSQRPGKKSNKESNPLLGLCPAGLQIARQLQELAVLRFSFIIDSIEVSGQEAPEDLTTFCKPVFKHVR